MEVCVPYHGHAEHQRGDKVDGRLALPLPQLVECVEEIYPTYDPQEQAKNLMDRGSQGSEVKRKTESKQDEEATSTQAKHVARVL